MILTIITTFALCSSGTVVTMAPRRVRVLFRRLLLALVVNLLFCHTIAITFRIGLLFLIWLVGVSNKVYIPQRYVPMTSGDQKQLVSSFRYFKSGVFLISSTIASIVSIHLVWG